MGQGLHSKVAQVVATEFDIPLEKVHIKEMATDKIANASPTAASMGSDTYAMAALNAAKQITARLAPYRTKDPHATFAELAVKAYFDRVNLTAHGFFKSEHEGYDIMTGKGKPWRYFTLGTACTEVEVDCLTGDHKILRTDLVLDIGNPINPAIDIGQIEGAFMQGAGWVSIEELIWGDNQHEWVRTKGRLQSNGPGAYKIPSADDIPMDWRITLLKDEMNPKYETIPVQSSKAVGEPPLLLGLNVFFAIKEAIKAARRQEGLVGFLPINSPITSERIRMACADRFTRLAVGDKTTAEQFVAKGSF
jgi:xanthine dehydrogenase/oxidase